MRKCLHIFFIFIVFYSKLVAQTENFNFINFGYKEGLTDNFAYNATQDKLGYMWFATPSGLYRFDGHTFKIFRSPLDKPGRAISNILQTVYTAKNGILWLGGFNTIQWYNPVKNIFFGPDYSKPEIIKLCNAYVLSFTEDKTGIWVATDKDYFFHFNTGDSTFTNYGYLFPHSASKSSKKIIIADNSIWAIHSEGLYQFSFDNALLEFYPFSSSDISNGVFDSVTNSLMLTSYNNGLIFFSLSKKKYDHENSINKLLAKANLFCIENADENIAWVGSYPLYRINKKNNTILAIDSKKESEYDLKTSKIGSLFFDREKNLWICGYDGLSMLPWQNQQIQAAPLKDDVNGIMVEPIGVNSMAGNNDLIISNTNAVGLIYYNSATGKATTIQNAFAKQADEKSIKGIVTTAKGEIFVSDGLRFFKFLPIEKKLIPFLLKDQNDNPIRNAGRNIFDAKGKVYIGSLNNGFYIWNTISNKLTHYNKWDLDTAASAKADNNLYPCLTDTDNNIWFTSNSGIYEFKTNENKLYHHAYKEYKNVPILSTSNYITQDKAGHYWITTKNNGMYEFYFEKGNEVLKNYTQDVGMGLPSDYLIKIKPDLKDSSLWISYNAGLIKFDPVKKKVITILKQQNGLSADAGGYTFIITPNNRLVQLHYGSMNIIDLNRYQFNKTVPAISFNSVKVFDKEMVYGLIEKSATLTLNNSENFLQFEFAALSFNNSTQNQYAYKLEGADKDWIYCGNRNFVSYSGLKDGSYVFKVKAANNDGVWNTEELVLYIIIHPPFYKTAWFIILCMLVPVSFIYAWNRYRVKQIKKEEKLKTNFQQQIAQIEMKALRAQMNPHFIFNSLNSIQKYILQNDQFAASQYLTKFSRLIRLILDHSNQNNILLSSELALIKLYIELESMRFDNKFNYEIKVHEDVKEETTEIPSMLIQPYIENAIWHGLLHKEERGNLLIEFYKNGSDNLIVIIQDDGIGREKATALKSKQVLKKKSFGMQITKDRIGIINKTQNILATSKVEDLKDLNGNSRGTKVILCIPVKSLNR